VVSRPGFSLADAARALPERLRPSAAALRAPRHQQAEGIIALPGATIHLLGDVREKVSSTQVRAAAGKSVKQLSRYVPLAVAEYIRKEHLYMEDESMERGRAGAFWDGRGGSRDAGVPKPRGVRGTGWDAGVLRSQAIAKERLQSGVERSDKKEKVLSFEESRHRHAGRSHKNG